ncbi:MAG TPA: glycosyltransferase family 39 protein [Cytophagaceae bacterium]|jgi:hypothetical protein|nr:glycosyltransferase family 39 protein [Cytophagaceae bacterium]
MIFSGKKTNIKELVFIALLLLPLFLINVRKSHDWGGDFALYIKQGMNIIDGKPQGDNGYVFNEYFPYLAPPTYSVGFPLLLAPVYGCFGNSILHFSLYLTVLLIAALLAFYFFFRMYYSVVVSSVAVIVIAYNPWLLWFKCEILSDIPFALFVMLSLIGYLKTNWEDKSYKNAVLIGLLCGYALLIKSIGIVLLAAFCLDNAYAIFNDHKNKRGYVRLWNVASILGSALFIYILLSKVVFPGKADSYSFFSTLFTLDNIGDTMLSTSNYYIQVFQDFFHPQAGQWNFVPLIVKAFALSFFLLGILLKLVQQRSVIDYILLLYLTIVICFPNTTQGFRYLFPLCGIIFYYIIYAFQSIRLEASISSSMIACLIGVVVLLTYKHAAMELINTQDSILMGPQEPEAIEAFAYVRDHVPAEEVLVFNKPTVSSLYAGKNSVGYHRDQDSLSMEKKFAELNVHYVLECVDLKTSALDAYLERHKEALDTIFTNAKFKLYKQRR